MSFVVDNDYQTNLLFKKFVGVAAARLEDEFSVEKFKSVPNIFSSDVMIEEIPSQAPLKISGPTGLDASSNWIDSSCNYANNSSVDNDVYPDGIICVSNCNDDFSLAEDTDVSPTAAVFSDYIEVFTTDITQDLNGNILNCDIDGDGIVNWEDPDVDGDGFINTDVNEIDIDGDGVYDLDGNCIEKSPEDVFKRLSSFLATTELSKSKQKLCSEIFYNDLYEGRFVSGGRVLAGAGDLYRVKTLANCLHKKWTQKRISLKSHSLRILSKYAIISV